MHLSFYDLMGKWCVNGDTFEFVLIDLNLSDFNSVLNDV